jgi:hypothetical protein
MTVCVGKLDSVLISKSTARPLSAFRDNSALSFAKTLFEIVIGKNIKLNKVKTLTANVDITRCSRLIGVLWEKTKLESSIARWVEGQNFRFFTITVLIGNVIPNNKFEVKKGRKNFEKKRGERMKESTKERKRTHDTQSKHTD